MKAKIFLIFLLSFLLGCLVAPFFTNEQNIYTIVGVLLIFSSFLIYRKRIFWVIIASVGFFFLSLSNFYFQQNYYENLNKKYQTKAIFTGYVSEIPEKVEHGERITIRVEKTNDAPANFSANFYKNEFPAVKVGQKLTVSGEMKPYKEDKKARSIKQKIAGEIAVEKLAMTGDIVWNVKTALLLVRQKFNESLASSLPKDEANLASGLILGEKALQTAEFTRSLQASGTSHIIALSGYNITIILSIFLVLCSKFSRKVNLFLPIFFMILFIVMTGGAASIVRAGIMGVMPILARYIGRPSNPLIAIIFSAALMVLVNPYILLYDVGFQLSFGAMVGLVYLSPMIYKSFREGVLYRLLAETLSAQIAVLPLLVYYFGQVSIVSPISNLVILGLVPVGMLISFLTGVFGLVSPSLGYFGGIISYPLLKSIDQLIIYFGNLPFALTQVKIDNPVWILIYYLALINVIYLIKVRFGRSPGA